MQACIYALDDICIRMPPKPHKTYTNCFQTKAVTPIHFHKSGRQVYVVTKITKNAKTGGGTNPCVFSAATVATDASVGGLCRRHVHIVVLRTITYCHRIGVKRVRLRHSTCQSVQTTMLITTTVIFTLSSSVPKGV